MVSILLSIAFIVCSAWVDKDTLEWSYIYSHKSRFFQRGVFFALFCFYSWTGAIGFILLFMALFDQVLNKMRGLELFYLGNIARWDILFNKHIFLYLSVKVLTLGLGIWISLI